MRRLARIAAIALLLALALGGYARLRAPARQPEPASAAEGATGAAFQTGEPRDSPRRPPRAPREGKGKSPVPRSSSALLACFSPDGGWLLTVTAQCEAALRRPDAAGPVWWVKATAEPYRYYLEDEWHSRPMAAGFSADGRSVFVASGYWTAELDLKTGAVLRTADLPCPAAGPDSTFGMAFVPGTDSFAYAGEGDRLLRADARTGRVKGPDLVLPGELWLGLSARPDGRRVLAYDRTEGSGYLAEWDLATGELIPVLGDVPANIGEVSYGPGWDRAWIPGRAPIVIDLRTGKRVKLPGELGRYEGQTWVSPDGRRVIGRRWSTQEEDRIDLFRAEDGKLLASFSSRGLWWRPFQPWDPTSKLLTCSPGHVVFHPDGRTILLANGHAAEVIFGFWDLDTGEHIRTIRPEP